MIIKRKIKKVEEVGCYDDEFVFDIGIKGDCPYFFGNNILLHNSSYFSCVNELDKPFFKEKYPNFQLNKDNVVELYDNIAGKVNSEFPEFMNKSFNTGMEKGRVIAAERELVATKGLFIRKKKYAVMVYDKEKKRLDINDSPGEIKAMGLDLKRADTNAVMQDFLEEILTDILTGSEEKPIIDKIKNFRENYKTFIPWEMGIPKKVNGLTKYTKLVDNHSKFSVLKEKKRKLTIPFHVKASMNWNTLIDIHNDRYSSKIYDGSKIIVCYLNSNEYNFKEIAYPYDQTTLPEWFKKLPFNKELMVKTMVDKKILNLLEILEWDLQETKKDTTFDDIFVY